MSVREDELRVYYEYIEIMLAFERVKCALDQLPIKEPMVFEFIQDLIGEWTRMLAQTVFKYHPELREEEPSNDVHD